MAIKQNALWLALLFLVGGWFSEASMSQKQPETDGSSAGTAPLGGLEAAVLAAARSADVHQLDSSIPSQAFESWLRGTTGGAAVTWKADRCTRQLPTPAASDTPLCALAAVTFSDGATAAVSIKVGSMERGISSPYELWMVDLAEGKPRRTLELSDLPIALAPHLRLAVRENGSNVAKDINRSADCPALLSGAEGLLKKEAVLLIGEVRGTQESPRFAAQLACYLLKYSEVLVELEIPVSEQAHIDKFISSSGTKEDIRALLTEAFWSRGFQDGRASRAMFSLLDEMRVLRHRGQPLWVVCIDAPGDQMLASADSKNNDPENVDPKTHDPKAHDPKTKPKTSDKNRIWAANILRAKLAHPHASVVALLGRAPARMQIGLPGNPNYVPAGWYVKQKIPQALSLTVSFAKGGAWTCQQDGCAIHPMEGDGEGDKPYVRLGAGEDGSVGTIFFPALTPSEPAKTLLQSEPSAGHP